MGNHYTNVVVAGPDRQDIAEVLTAMGRHAALSPTHEGRTVVYDALSDEQNPAELARLAGQISVRLLCPAWAVMNHDDDVLWYQLWDHGALVDEYDSCPDYFEPDGGDAEPRGGDGQKLGPALGSPAAASRINEILRSDDYVFEAERHADLAEALGLPSDLLCCGYLALVSGSLPESGDDILWVGGGGPFGGM